MPRRLVRTLLLLTLLALPIEAAQTSLIAPRIKTPVDENALTTLRGNTHPLARSEFDQGAAPSDLAMNRILLVLRRSPEQESALTRLLEAQQDKSSVNYHQWLTPTEFGQQFGPADQDIQQVTTWLSQHGFQSIQVSRGRVVIEFSGTAGQVEAAFHTSIHKYTVNGDEHWANSSDPQIPAALAPVVAGPLTLHNFLKKPQVAISNERFTSRAGSGIRPQVTSATGANALGPKDFTAIYNANPLYSSQPSITGNNAKIAIVSRTDIQTQDVYDFRTVFLGPPYNDNTAINLLTGADPGDLGGDDEVETVLDASWAGVAAPDAAVALTISASTATTDGADLSELYIIDNNFADILTESFGSCEGANTSIQAATVSLLAEQAAAQGISVVVSSGDSGAAGCDDSEPAAHPASVNVLASSPYTIAVGGTEFNEMGNSSLYWNSSSGSLESALSYIPENVWNESCAAGQCPSGATPNIAAGGGGASVFFSKPSWQSGVVGIPAQNARYLPDVSLSAAGHDPYLICLHLSCLSHTVGQISFTGVYGTSASAQAFAGILALLVQKTGSRLGQPNFTLYKLAAAENLSQCNGSNAPALSAGGTCIFNDVTVGNNSVPGLADYGSPTAQYQSGVGFDLASGLGSVNIANLVNGWNTAPLIESTTTLSINNGLNTIITHGQSVPISITVAPKPPATGVATGDVGLTAGENADQGFGIFTLSNGTVNTNTAMLPGGSYTVTAHYGGDATFSASDSPTSQFLTVNPEPSKTVLTIVTFDSAGNRTGTNPSTVAYGSNYALIVKLTNAAGDSCLPAAEGGPVCPGYGVSLTDTLNGQQNQLDAGFYPPDAFGMVEDDVIDLSVGSHLLAATYTGDKNFASSTATTSVNVTPLALTISANPSTVSVSPGNSVMTMIALAEQAGYGPVSFSCAALPPLSTCNFSPPSLTGAGQTALTITIPSHTMSVPDSTGYSHDFRWPFGMALVAAAVLSFLHICSKRHRLGPSWAFLLLISVLACLATGCGGGGSDSGGGTTSGTSSGSSSSQSIVVIATGKDFAVTTILTLTIR